MRTCTAAGGNGQIVLPYRAADPAGDRLDSQKQIAVGYSDVDRGCNGKGRLAAQSAAVAGAGPLLWWCDGPCGSAKAAVSHAAAKEHRRFSP